MVKQEDGNERAPRRKTIKLDVRFPMHDKLARVSPGAECLWIRSLAWSHNMDRDGEIPANLRIVWMRDGDPGPLAAELIEAGIWHERNGGGFQIHDFDHYHPTKKSQTDVSKRNSDNATRGHETRRLKRRGFVRPASDPQTQEPDNLCESQPSSRVRPVSVSVPDSVSMHMHSERVEDPEQATRSGGGGMRIHANVDQDTCLTCIKRHGSDVPAGEPIPPWDDCESDRGCRCYATPGPDEPDSESVALLLEVGINRPVAEKYGSNVPPVRIVDVIAAGRKEGLDGEELQAWTVAGIQREKPKTGA